MPIYRFIVHGTDVAVPEGRRGFFTTRHASGRDREQAEAKVLRRLSREFTSGVSAKIWGGGPPDMVIEDCWTIGVHQLFAAPNRGSIFYDDRDEPSVD